MSVVNRVLAALLPLALLLSGLLAATEIVLAQLDRLHWLAPTSCGAPGCANASTARGSPAPS